MLFSNSHRNFEPGTKAFEDALAKDIIIENTIKMIIINILFVILLFSTITLIFR